MFIPNLEQQIEIFYVIFINFPYVFGIRLGLYIKDLKIYLNHK